MESSIGRPRIARTYAGLIALVTLVVIVQGILFGGFYNEFDQDLIDAHGFVGSISMLVAVLIMIPLGFLARFPRGLWIGPLTVLLAVLWVVQYMLGFTIEDDRWVATIHIALAFLIFGGALLLTARAHRAIAGRG